MSCSPSKKWRNLGFSAPKCAVPLSSLWIRYTCFFREGNYQPFFSFFLVENWIIDRKPRLFLRKIVRSSSRETSEGMVGRKFPKKSAVGRKFFGPGSFRSIKKLFLYQHQEPLGGCQPSGNTTVAKRCGSFGQKCSRTFLPTLSAEFSWSNDV